MKQAIIDLDEEKAVAAAEEVVTSEIDPKLAIRYAIAGAASIVGEKFEAGDYFLPQLVISGDLMDVVTKVSERNIPKTEVEQKKIIVIGTVQGDVHNIGKSIVATMLKSVGFQVVDLGVDVPSVTFIGKAKDLKADIIALSSLLTTTMPYQREVIDDLVSMGLRDRFRVMLEADPLQNPMRMRLGRMGMEGMPSRPWMLPRNCCL